MVTKCFDFFNKWHIVSLIQLLGHPWISTSRWAAGWNVSHEEKPKKVFVALEKGFSIFLKNTLAIPGHFLFVLSFPFLQQWTNYKVWTKIVHDWIWTRPFWYRKWRLCHSHCPSMKEFFHRWWESKDFLITMWPCQASSAFVFPILLYQE